MRKSFIKELSSKMNTSHQRVWQQSNTILCLINTGRVFLCETSAGICLVLSLILQKQGKKKIRKEYEGGKSTGLEKSYSFQVISCFSCKISKKLLQKSMHQLFKIIKF